MNKSYRNRAELYKRFVNPKSESFDFSEESLKELFDYESRGVGNCDVYDRYTEFLLTGKKQNGYAIGKRFLDITISMWKEDSNEVGWGNLLESLAEEFDIDWLKSIFKYEHHQKFLEECRK
jgi:hypothetical protein